jgi:hypothetical protein
MTDTVVGSDESRQSKGGKARAALMSPEERSENARIAAEARWGTHVPKATHYGELRLGEVTLPCFVLEALPGETERRVLSQNGMIAGLGMSRGGSSQGGDRLAGFTHGNRIKPFISERLSVATISPIRFRPPSGGVAFGYDCEVLADLCDAVLKARRDGILQKQQLRVATRCEILQSGFARVGIAALIDEATGFQANRNRDALATIFNQFLAKELRPWTSTFPADFYRELFRLRGWEYTEASARQKPRLVGALTNSIVYARLAPGLLEELRRLTPRNDKGRLKHHFHRRLTDDIGVRKLREHLACAMAFMRAADSYDSFIALLDRACPKYGQNFQLALAEQPA